MTGPACVTGRFQPVHAQHLELFAIALTHAEHLIVAVTNPDPGARRAEPTSEHRHRDRDNPFTYFQRIRMLDAALTGAGLAGRTTIVPFDLTRPEHWTDYVPGDALQVVRAYSAWERHKARLLREGGYRVLLLDGDPDRRVSASAIREAIAGDGDWPSLVPDAVVPVLRGFLAPAGDHR